MANNRISHLAGRCLLMLAVALAGSVGLAQVTVNAPKGILNRGNTPTQQEPKQDQSKQEQPAGQTATAGESSQPTTGAEAEAAAPVVDDKPHSLDLKPQDIDAFSFSSQVIVGTAAGYRVQIFFSSEHNASDAAKGRAREVAMVFPHYRDYISYNAPQWRLRVGDFTKRQQADRAARKIMRQFPEFRSEVAVVRDHINLWH